MLVGTKATNGLSIRVFVPFVCPDFCTVCHRISLVARHSGINVSDKNLTLG